MNIKEKFKTCYGLFDNKCLEQFGFRLKDISLDNVVDYMHAGKDSSSLAVCRILFGLAMLFDIPDERGGATLERRWANPSTCHYPLLPFILPLPLVFMAMVYLVLWCGAVGIMLGYRYGISCVMFTAAYWYLFLIEKSFWNNHSYLFGLVGFLLCFTRANSRWSIDAYLHPSIKQEKIPYWNYFIIKYQFFILYFMAGLKKGTAEWLTGYSVLRLGEHWVFLPFKPFLTVAQIDFLIVHCFIFLFDLTVAVWMMYCRTRHVAMVFCALFHLMNSRLFTIGMFPWVCLATMPLFYPFNWPFIVVGHIKNKLLTVKNEIMKQMFFCKGKSAAIDHQEKYFTKNVCKEASSESNKKELFEKGNLGNGKDDPDTKILNNTTESCKNENYKNRVTVCYMILLYVLLQAFLPFSHFITKGYNNWTNGLYGYSWDMMVHTWDLHSIVIKVVDNDRNTEFFIDPELYNLNDRWTRHNDMLMQYAHCLKNNLMTDENYVSENISIYADIWYSMNGRFTQRMFDNKVDLLQASWSPFEKTSYVMPLIDEGLEWRSRLQGLRDNVYSWSNQSDVIFIADFPGYDYQRFLRKDLTNITLTILNSTVLYEPEVTNCTNGQSILLSTGDQIQMTSDSFHKIINIGQTPAFYMITFYDNSETQEEKTKEIPMLPIVKELTRRFKALKTFINLVFNNLFTTCFFLANSC